MQVKIHLKARELPIEWCIGGTIIRNLENKTVYFWHGGVCVCIPILIIVKALQLAPLLFTSPVYGGT